MGDERRRRRRRTKDELDWQTKDWGSERGTANLLTLPRPDDGGRRRAEGRTCWTAPHEHAQSRRWTCAGGARESAKGRVEASEDRHPGRLRATRRSGPRGASFVACCTSKRHLLPVDAAPLLEHADVAERATRASGARHDRPRSGGGWRVGLGPQSVHAIARTDHRLHRHVQRSASCGGRRRRITRERTDIGRLSAAPPQIACATSPPTRSGRNSTSSPARPCHRRRVEREKSLSVGQMLSSCF